MKHREHSLRYSKAHRNEKRRYAESHRNETRKRDAAWYHDPKNNKVVLAKLMKAQIRYHARRLEELTQDG